MRLVALLLLCGLLLTAGGIFLLYTPLPEQHGLGGLFLVTLMIVVGLLLLIPAKVYIIIKLTARRNKHSG